MAEANRKDDQLTGAHFGAIRVKTFDKLYTSQKDAVVRIIRAVHHLACQAFEERLYGGAGESEAEQRARRNALLHQRNYQRPHNAYVIDGPRGSGKTTALLTIRSCLEDLRLDPTIVREAPRASGNAAQRGGGDVSEADLQALGLAVPKRAHGGERATLLLPVVFTEDMEQREASMDAIFALIQDRIEERLEDETNNEQKRKLNTLLHELRNEVTLPWAYSRGVGQEALAQDTLTYEDYISRRADYNRKTYTRIPIWHAFLEKLLDGLGYQILVVQFDDSDLDQRAAEDILRAIRIYLSHPRVVTILAVDMTTLSTVVTARNLVENHDVIDVLASVDAQITPKAGALLDDIIQMNGENSRALLDKILPVPLRAKLKFEDLSNLDGFFITPEASQDEAVDAFGTWCRVRFNVAPDQRSKSAWWLLAGPYRRMVADNIRHAVSFREQTKILTAQPLAALGDYYRLRSLMVLVEGSLDRLREIIETRVLEATWTRNADRGMITDDYEERFVDLWVDAQVVLRKLDVRNSAVVAGWLPSTLGDGIGLTLMDEDKRFGVAGVEPSRLPRNCLYVYQYRRLSELIAEPLPDRSRWARYLEEFDPGLLATASKDLLSDIKELPDVEVLHLICTSSIDFARGASSFAESYPPRLLYFAKRSIAALCAAAAPTVVDRNSFVQSLQALAAGEIEPAALFVEKLAEATIQAETQRQEALFTWACALEIAEAGDDNRSLRAPRPRRQLSVSLGPDGKQQEQQRLNTLVSKTVDFVKPGGRHALLLQWSIVPLLESIHDYGTNYQRPPEGVASAWSNLRKMSVAGLRPSESGTDWVFADFEPKVLTGIENEVTAFIASFNDRLGPETAPGSILLKDGWPATPRRLLAALLITSEAWVEKNLDV